ncbi:MAG TPA: glycosyltransferase family 2 protein [Candidatus Saccharimonadales bacterium]|nr:glycosyltransferase family 2 protein [Candidatus Saccharimonadales bacterium]
MSDLEIPYEKDRRGHYRFFEILPGGLSWLLVITLVTLSLVNATLAVFVVLAYLLIFFVRGLAYAVRALDGYRTMKRHLRLDWNGLAADIDAGQVVGKAIKRPKWHLSNLKRLDNRTLQVRSSELTHAVVIATVNESREVLEPTIQAVLASDYDPKKMILVMAYEARAGQESEDRVKQLMELYQDKFGHAMAIKHPANIPGEVIGKGGNVTYAGRQLAAYVKKAKLDPARVLVTTLDADNRPDKRYFAALSYLYCVVPDPLKASYQPLPMFTNNIWDAPTMMRVIATGNNLFYIVQTQRPHLSRNFSAHAQPLQALIEMDFWSVRTIVEDGHHFWRSYFHYDGDYRVYPLSIPIYQDAVLADGYWQTIKAQFYQLRRWTYGASDIAYIADKGFYRKNKAPKGDVIAKFSRALEGHVSWATSTIIVLFAAFLPPLFHPQNLAANELPLIVSRVQRIGLIGLIITVYVCLVTLPPRPARHKRHRSLLMLVQWVLLPVTSIGFGSLAAFNSQTRLMFKKYLSTFDVTEKATVTASGKRISTKADPSRAKRSKRRLRKK